MPGRAGHAVQACWNGDGSIEARPAAFDRNRPLDRWQSIAGQRPQCVACFVEYVGHAHNDVIELPRAALKWDHPHVAARAQDHALVQAGRAASTSVGRRHVHVQNNFLLAILWSQTLAVDEYPAGASLGERDDVLLARFEAVGLALRVRAHEFNQGVVA